MIAIECKAWAENIEHDRMERRGIAHFEVRGALTAFNTTLFHHTCKKGWTVGTMFQKLFELVEIFGKMNWVLQNYWYVWCIMKKHTQMKLKSFKISSYSKYFLAHIAFSLILRPIFSRFSKSYGVFPERKKLSAPMKVIFGGQF